MGFFSLLLSAPLHHTFVHVYSCSVTLENKQPTQVAVPKLCVDTPFSVEQPFHGVSDIISDTLHIKYFHNNSEE